MITQLTLGYKVASKVRDKEGFKRIRQQNQRLCFADFRGRLNFSLFQLCDDETCL